MGQTLRILAGLLWFAACLEAVLAVQARNKPPALPPARTVIEELANTLDALIWAATWLGHANAAGALLVLGLMLWALGTLVIRQAQQAATLADLSRQLREALHRPAPPTAAQQPQAAAKAPLLPATETEVEALAAAQLAEWERAGMAGATIDTARRAARRRLGLPVWE